MKKLLLISLLAITAAQADTTTDKPTRLLGSDEVDCKRVKGYSAQKTCMEEQAKAKALEEQINNITDSTGKRLGDRMAHVGSGHLPIAYFPDAGLTCERHHTRVEDHKTITITDASFTINKKGNIYIYLKVKNNYNEEDIPQSYLSNLIPKTFAAVMTDGRKRILNNGYWLGKDVRVHGNKEYKLQFFVNNPEGEAVANIVCLN